MKIYKNLLKSAVGALLVITSIAGHAADLINQKEETWIAKNFRFHNGEVMPEMKVNFITLGNPKGDPVLVLHGTTSSSRSMLSPGFAGELFGEGQPLDASKYFIIIPDTIGAGKSSKPSDGLRMSFPKFNYYDMVDAQYRLLTEHLGVKHLRVVIGNSMGGMNAWVWATRYPAMLDIAVPMASFPTEMSGRNWMLRRLLVESIKRDPEWNGGNYTKQPSLFPFHNVFFNAASNGGDQGLSRIGATREKADQYLDKQLATPLSADANDFIYIFEASGDFNVSPKLEQIRATVLSINSSDDERNPRALGVMEKELPRIKNAREVVVQGTPFTGGHNTSAQEVKAWKPVLEEVLKTAPRL